MSLWILDVRRALFSIGVALRYVGGLFVMQLLGRPIDPKLLATRLRLLFETLGLTYMKIGQYLAARIDLVPEEVTRELRRLFERAKPVPFERIRLVVESELGQSLEEAFAEFDTEPTAAASVAQVHQAVTHDGNRVAVKVQRPEVDRIFAADMRNLRRFAAVVDALGLLGTISLKEMLTEFAVWTSRELDFTTEGRTADRLRNESLPGGTVPLVYWDLTRRHVLTMEFIEGKSLAQVMDMIERNETQLLEEEYPELDLRQVAENFSFVILNQLFVTGFFHGDPHPGNIFLRGDNTVVFLDFGIFGEMSDSQRENMAAHVENEAMGNIDASYRYYSKQLRPTDETDMRAFERDAKAVLQVWYDNGMSPDAESADRLLGKYGGEMLKVVRKHHLRMTTDTLLFWRAMEALDATALRFAKYYDQLSAMRSFFEQVRPSPIERLRQITTDPKPWLSLEQLYSSIPNSVRAIISNLKNQLPLSIQVRESLQVRRARNRRTKLLVSPMFAISGLLILVRLPVGTTAQVILAVLVTSLCGITLLQWFRR